MNSRWNSTPALYQNPQLDGSPFFWEAGPIGVLLIHGFTATTAEVRPLARALLAEGYTVSGPLLPGHGVSPEDANRYTWNDLTNAIQHAYLALNKCCQKVFVGGESMGGLLALYQAAVSPEISGVLAYAPAIRLRAWWIPYLARGLRPFTAYRPKPPAVPSPAEAMWSGYSVYPLKAMTELFKLQKEVSKRLGSIHAPILLSQGALDQSIGTDCIDVIAQKVSSSYKEIHWLNQSGHCVLLDCERTQVERISKEFIQKVIQLPIAG